MEALRKEHEGLEKENLGMSIKDIDQVIELMERAREGIAADPESGRLALAKLKNATKTPLDNANKHLKPIHEALKGYSKALDKKFKDKPLPSAENDALSSHPVLINRALAMHLLREGQFSVASTFIEEANRQAPVPEPTPGTPDPYMEDVWQKELANGKFDSKKLQEQFGEMYNILHELRMQKNLAPAIQWARQNRTVLENRGSNLEFELCRLQFICLYMGHDAESPTMDPELGPVRAWQYAYKEFQPFQYRYAKELQQLIGAMAFYTNVWDSPYRRLFHNDSAWEEVATSFTREFCSLLGLSADSPLYIAATAGSIALPTFLKLQNIMKQKHTEWTTSHELPVEIPLPPGYQFHSIFVCPVSKEQATDANPAMMMTCGHVICRESMERLSKNGRFKCPYCPIESYSKDARRVYL